MRMTPQPTQSAAPVPGLGEAKSGADEIDLATLFSTIWRGKWFIGFFALLMAVAGAYYAIFMTTSRYQATTVIMLDTQQENVVDLDSVVGGLNSDTKTINSEIEVMRSRGLIGKVVDKLDLTNDPDFNGRLRPPSQMSQWRTAARELIAGPAPANPQVASQVDQARIREAVISAVIGSVQISNVRSSFVFRITTTSTNPQKAALVSDTLAELYVLNQLEVKFEATQQATQWLTEQVADLQIQLEDAEVRLADFSTSTDLVSVEALQLLERQLKDTRERLAEARETVDVQGKQAAELRAAPTRAARAELAKDTQLTRFLPQVDQNERMALAFDARFDQIVARLEVEVVRAAQQVTALGDSSKDLQIRIEQQGKDLIALQQYRREAEAIRALYEYFLGRLKETSAQQGIQQADSRILSRAVVPAIASQPRRSRIVVMTFMLGLVIGAALVLLRELRSSTFRTASDLERFTGYTVLGQIPTIPKRNRKSTLQYLSDKPTSAAAEAIRNLRTSVLLSNVDKPPQVIISTSSVPSEGKTTNSLALSHNLIGMGKSVILIEGDIRRRTFSQYFKTSSQHGLVSVINGDSTLEETVVKSPGFGADILMGEKTSINAADIFTSNKFKKLVADLRDKYDMIVIDTPPVLVVPDARIIAQEADAVLFTVKWDQTSKFQVDEALKMFEQANTPVTGLVLSQVSPRGMKRYGYGGKYGAYSAYGSKYYTN